MDKLSDAKRAVQMGRITLDRYRKALNDLIDINAEDELIAIARARLQMAEAVHAKDLAELKRLITH